MAALIRCGFPVSITGTGPVSYTHLLGPHQLGGELQILAHNRIQDILMLIGEYIQILPEAADLSSCLLYTSGENFTDMLMKQRKECARLWSGKKSWQMNSDP